MSSETNEADERANRKAGTNGVGATAAAAAAAGTAAGLAASVLAGTVIGHDHRTDRAGSAPAGRDPFDDLVPPATPPATAATVDVADVADVPAPPAAEPTAPAPAEVVTETVPTAPAPVAEVATEPVHIAAAAPPPTAEPVATEPVAVAEPVTVDEPVAVAEPVIVDQPVADPAVVEPPAVDEPVIEEPPFLVEPVADPTVVDPITGPELGGTGFPPEMGTDIDDGDMGGGGIPGPDRPAPAPLPEPVAVDPITPPPAPPVPTPPPLIEIAVFDGPPPDLSMDPKLAIELLNTAAVQMNARVDLFGSLSTRDIDNDDRVELWRALKSLNPTLQGGPRALQGTVKDDWTLEKVADAYDVNLAQLAMKVNLESNDNINIAHFAQQVTASSVNLDPHVVSVEVDGHLIQFDSNGQVTVHGYDEGTFQTVDFETVVEHSPAPGAWASWLFYIDDEAVSSQPVD